ncbi:MAG TPA: TrkH family potassium uptake protein [Gemmatimonadota bacterium]|nr:TrkH family potassium uptake protein [Gemmatimonadota bacterium]
MGTAALSLPAAAGEGTDIRWIDALFTATSAVCVTGLITLDTASAWSPLGQGIILALIQLGGLGILTFSTFFLVLFGRRLTFGQRDIVTRAHGHLMRIDVRGLTLRIVVYTLTIEAIGALFLSARFAREENLGTAVWRGTFHAVSAFCNAGFSLFSTGLEVYSGSWVVNLTVVALILLGGIGFVVITDVEEWLRGRKALSLHSRVVLAASGVLVVVGMIGFAAFEAENALRGRPLGEMFLVTLFQAVTPRTAGFNTVPYGELTNATLMLTMILMFIGGSPGSTAGGIKTPTAAILWGLLAARARGFRQAHLFRRAIPERVVGEAVSIVLLSIGVVMLATFALQFTELHHLAPREVRGRFLELNFEAVSAFGTVGLSTGVTSALQEPSKLVIIVLMFVGRLGPLAVAVAIGRRRRREYEYAEEGVLVG